MTIIYFNLRFNCFIKTKNIFVTYHICVDFVQFFLFLPTYTFKLTILLTVIALYILLVHTSSSSIVYVSSSLILWLILWLFRLNLLLLPLLLIPWPLPLLIVAWVWNGFSNELFLHLILDSWFNIEPISSSIENWVKFFTFLLCSMAITRMSNERWYSSKNFVNYLLFYDTLFMSFKLNYYLHKRIHKLIYWFNISHL